MIALEMFVNDHKMRLEVGYGLEGALPDVTAKRILEDTIGPHFREGHYAEGLDAGVDAVMAATRGEYRAPVRKPTDTGAVALFVPLGFIGLIFLLSRRLNRPLGPLSPRGRRRRTFYIGSGGGWGGGGGGWGGGGGGGGGFSGGGGSFGGGGASGSW